MNHLLAAGVREISATKHEQIDSEIHEPAIEGRPLLWLSYAPLPFPLSKKVEGFTRRADAAWVLENAVVRL
jgi:hypothetical protein